MADWKLCDKAMTGRAHHHRSLSGLVYAGPVQAAAIGPQTIHWLINHKRSSGHVCLVLLPSININHQRLLDLLHVDTGALRNYSWYLT